MVEALGYKMRKYVLSTAIILFLLMGIFACTVCMLHYPLDGKAQSWCERKERAEKLCKSHNGITNVQYGVNICKDGTPVKVD